MTSVGNNVNSFPEDQLTKFSAAFRKDEGLICVSAVQFCKALSASRRRKSTDIMASDSAQ